MGNAPRVGTLLLTLLLAVACSGGPRDLLRYEELVAGVTQESVQETARRYLDNDRYVYGVLYPEKNTKTRD